MAEEIENISEDTRKILKSHTGERKGLIPLLQEVQERFGYLPREAISEVAKFLGLRDTTAYGVATFYNQFRFNPPGRHQIKVCLGTACHLKGGRTILEAWERELNMKDGETSPDREFSLDTVACVGCCALAPVTVVDKVTEGKVSPIRVKGVLLSFQLQKGEAEEGSPEKDP